MNKNKFKKGDKVRVLELYEGDENEGIKIGMEGIVMENDSFPNCKFPGIKEKIPMFEEQVELVNYSKKVGVTSSVTDRKSMPVFSGVLKYFPLALLELSKVSKAGTDQHNPGKPLFWDRSKSGDEQDALTRHLIDDAMDPGGTDTDGIRHKAKVAWRALASLQKELETAKQNENK